MNVKVIDDQHEILTGAIQRLQNAMAAGKGAAEVPQILEDLGNYTRFHFPTEERLMQTYGYPLRDAHSIEHRKFLARLCEVERIVAEGECTAASDLLNRLCEWLEDHTAGWDVRLGEFLNARGVT